MIVAGYGNKETDNQAYLGAGLRPDSVFIVNTRGEMRPTLVDLRFKTNLLLGVLKNVGTGLESSYKKQIEMIGKLYPQLNKD